MSVRLVNPPTDLARAQRAEFERWMICNSCGERWLVCGAISDLVDGVYRCFRCRWPVSLWEARKRAKATA